MATKSILICPSNITTYYYDDIKNEERAKKIVQAERARKSRIISLVAEEVAKGEYVLIEKFEYYSALMKAQPNVRVPCLVYPGTSDEERLIHILKISIPLVIAFFLCSLVKKTFTLNSTICSKIIVNTKSVKSRSSIG